MMGTITSRLFTVAFLRSTMRAASAVSTSVVVSGGMWKAFWKEELTELEITWLMPHQHSRPEAANRAASTERRSFLPRLRSASTWR